MQTLVAFLRTFGIGLLMGACDVVPGVSGGTIAFVTGVYQRLLGAIGGVDRTLRHHIRAGQRSAARAHVDGGFLLTLLAGVLTSILTLATVITRALQTYPSLVYSFFAGLIIASVWMIAGRIHGWTWHTFIRSVLGLAIGLLITQLSPGAVADPMRWMVMGAAAIAICAMILPGISGSFLLLIMGMYAVTIDALHARDVIYIALFGVGAVVGLMSFVRVVRGAFIHYHDQTIAVLIGLMLGSLPLLSPRTATPTPNTSQYLIWVGLFLGGFVLVKILEHRKDIRNSVSKKRNSS